MSNNYNTKSKGSLNKKSSGKGGSINRYFYSKTWDKGARLYLMDQQEVINRIENGLPLDDLYDTLDNKYKRKNVKNENKNM
jgi:hypothetical protein